MAHLNLTSLSATAPFIESVRKGFPTEALDHTADLLKVDLAVLLQVLGVSERTVQRKNLLDEPLSAIASDRLSRIDRIFALARGNIR